METISYLPPRTIAVPDTVYDAFMVEVMALPQKKRNKWHNSLTDKWGTRTKCVFRDGQILNWSMRGSHWAIVVPFRDNRQFITCSSVGLAMTRGEDAFDHAFAAALAANHTGNHYRNHAVKVPKQNDARVRG